MSLSKWCSMECRMEAAICPESHIFKRHRRRAFTLVELLVVIGIIALLISILLPSLNKAREQAKLILCMSNMRSLGQAVAIYQSENKGAFPPVGSSRWANHIWDPTVWSLLSYIPVQSKVRYCPTVADSLPFQDLTGPNSDGKPCYTTRSHVSFLYNEFLGGLDNRNGPWIAQGSGVDATTPTIPVTYTHIPAASETMLFMEYPQLVVVDTAYESTGMDRGMVNIVGYSLYSGSTTDPLMITIRGVQHQVFYAVAPVHNRRPSKASIHFLTGAGSSVPTMQGTINICYADSSVRSVFVQQGQAPAGVSLGTITRGDPSIPWDLAMGTQNGSFLPGSSAPIQGTRYDPFRPW
jgi:prepilin-type N-terminal cleavage/methylation domain-containing protein